MKKSIYLPAVLLLFITVLTTSCDPEDVVKDLVETCDSTEVCDDVSFTTCSNGVETWYEYKGITYECESLTNCTQAASDLTAATSEDCE